MLTNTGFLVALGAIAGVATAEPEPASYPTTPAPALDPVVPCSSLTVSAPEGAMLVNITGTERQGVTFPGLPLTVDICDVEVYLTHGDAGDAVRFAIWLPLSGWNGRWQGTGGGGFGAGLFDAQLISPVSLGYAAGSTDAGVNLEGEPRYWAQDPQLVENFVHLSFHEMAVLGKDLATQYYGQKPRYSYWYGCSQGGRQGMSEVQRYPEDYDGVWAAAPAVNWGQLITGMYWPVVVQNSFAPKPLSDCLLNFITNASVKACDAADGARDGFLGNSEECYFDPATLVGTKVSCMNGDGSRTNTTITKAHARVWKGIREGLKDEHGKTLFYGLLPGANYTYEAVQPSFVIPKQWIADFLLRDPDYDFSQVGKEDLIKFLHQSVSEFDALWGTNEADISAFKERSGKIITYHGWSDQLIPPENTLGYWDRVVEKFGGDRKKVDDFYRVYMVPGLPHCLGGNGPQPNLLDTIGPLVDWVENGKAPSTIPFDGNGLSRNICKWPKQMKYKGSGDVAKAESWTCV